MKLFPQIILLKLSEKIFPKFKIKKFHQDSKEEL